MVAALPVSPTKGRSTIAPDLRVNCGTNCAEVQYVASVDLLPAAPMVLT